MHGRPRQPPRALTEEELAKIAKYNKHKTAALNAHKMKVYNETTAALTATLLVINPDFYTLFNFRKLIVLDMINKAPEKKEKLLEDELKLMQKALEKQPKSYYAWQHRVWVFEQGGGDLKRELEMTELFLTYDSRNFHCWNHRMHIAKLALRDGVVGLEDLLEFTTKKIKENFSNYSAWHARSVLLPLVFDERWKKAQQKNQEEGKEGNKEGASGDQEKMWLDILESEFALVTGAFAMETEDQSAWLYHRWLIAQVVRGCAIPQSSSSTAMTPESTSTSTTTTTTAGDDESKNNNQYASLVSLASLLPSLTFDPLAHVTLPTPSNVDGVNTLNTNVATTESSKAVTTNSDTPNESTPSSKPLIRLEAGSVPVPSLNPVSRLFLLSREINLLEHRILPLEPDSKWVIGTLAMLLSLEDALKKMNPSQSGNKEGAEREGASAEDGSHDNQKEKEGESEIVLWKRVMAMFDKLSTADPTRKGYYTQVGKRLVQSLKNGQ